MQKHEDGSVTLSRRELTSLNRAYKDLYQLVASGPTFLGDYFDTQKDYRRVCRWNEQLSGREYDYTDYE